MDFHTYTLRKDYDRRNEGEEYNEAMKKLIETEEDGVSLADVERNTVFTRTTFYGEYILQSSFRIADFSGADRPTATIKAKVITFNEEPPKEFLAKLETILGSEFQKE